MSFRDNLQHMRATHNMTQEQLAMLLGVSRQSVTKWEAERAYPEMDKLIKLCGIFNCTLDELVQGDLTKRLAAAPAAPVVPAAPAVSASSDSAGAVELGLAATERVLSTDSPQAASRVPAFAPAPALISSACVCGAVPGVGMPGVQQDVFGYDEHMRAFAWKIATGIAVIIASVALVPLVEGFSAWRAGVASLEGLAVVFVLMGVAAGIAFIIPAGMEHARFQRAHPFIADFYTQDDRDSSGRKLGRAIVAGIALILAGCSLAALFDGTGAEDMAGGVALLAVAAGVWLFVRFGMMHARMNLGEYNKEVTETLAQFMTDEEIEAIEDPVRRAAVRLEKRRSHVTGAVCGIIMILATIAALCLLFIPLGVEGVQAIGSPGWEPGGLTMFFWLPWPVGGLLCGIAALVVRLAVKEERA